MGIPISLDYSWFVIFALLTWMLAGSYYPVEFPDWSPVLYLFMGAVTAMMLFVSVLLHELGHAVIAMRYGIPVRSITLFLFGGVAEIGADPPSAAADFKIAVAGPLVSLILAAFFYMIQTIVQDAEPLLGLVKYLTYINFALFVFNLLPGYPLDGGRVFRSIVWAITGDMQRSTLIAAKLGRFFAFILIFLGAMQVFAGNVGGGLWMAFIGWFLDNAASAQLLQGKTHDLLAGHRVEQAMSAHCPKVPVEMTLEQLVEGYILGSGQRFFLVEKNQQIIGLVTMHQIKDIPQADRHGTSLDRVMLPLGAVSNVAPDDDLWEALQKMDQNGVNQLPVTKGVEVIGILNRESVISYLITLQELAKNNEK